MMFSDMPTGGSVKTMENEKKKIIIYNDSRVLGGHEMMTIEMANSLSQKYDVFFLCFNQEIKSRLNGRVRVVCIPPGPRWTQGGLYSYSPVGMSLLKSLFKQISPGLVIISQGMIESGLKGLRVSKTLRIKTVSYIPLCQSYRSIRARAGAIRDILNRGYYNSFDSFITISNEQASLIKSHLYGMKKIFVLNNIIDDKELKDIENDVLTIGEVLRIGMIGRVDFFQKGQDKAVEIALGLKRKSYDFKFVIIGDGKDKKALLEKISRNKLLEYFVLKGWLNNKREAYSGIDVVFVASRFEGVPLVLLESIYLKKVILAPDLDVFREYLDEEFLYKDHDDAVRKLLDIERIKKSFSRKIDAMRTAMLEKHNSNKFNADVYRIIDELTGKISL